jgi:hypothetical protein
VDAEALAPRASFAGARVDLLILDDWGPEQDHSVRAVRNVPEPLALPIKPFERPTGPDERFGNTWIRFRTRILETFLTSELRMV